MRELELLDTWVLPGKPGSKSPVPERPHTVPRGTYGPPINAILRDYNPQMVVARLFLPEGTDEQGQQAALLSSSLPQFTSQLKEGRHSPS